MQGTSLNFSPVLERPDLVPASLTEAIKSWTGPQKASDFLVAEIDPEFSGGAELCAKYGVDPRHGANCLIVEGKRGGISSIVVCLVPVGYRYDMSGVVRKKLNARQVSVASLDLVISKTQMEYGSITPIGLPKDWQVFIDPLVMTSERIIIGGGLKKSKLSIPSNALMYLPGAEIVEGLAKKIDP
ncbi:hypothetical protein CJD36_004360 [Flavipsychrobacter stenotrophus]|uniref:YbaK/aminoacyl-tRNA synthetase-associated domain-containing protein n=2 Tax=Flavipsychrobacter stenotrophus TaxID=2077091 RepID=A0A2S7T194_9BACT|nr:hypothetical protein CJD36_004360 [Flavipsychrobacter stenotrophus]